MNNRIPHNPDFTRLFILRHAQTALNAAGKMQGFTDAPLDHTGREQAKNLADTLYPLYAIDHIYTSPYPRAQETAQYVGRKYGLEVEPNDDLRELGFGEIDNERFEDLKTLAPDFYHQTNFLYAAESIEGMGKPPYPGGESIAQIRARVAHFTGQLLEKHKGKCVAAVSHGGFIKYLFAYYLGFPLEQPIFISIENTSISIVDFVESRAIVRCFNETGHLHSPIRYSRPAVV